MRWQQQHATPYEMLIRFSKVFPWQVVAIFTDYIFEQKLLREEFIQEIIYRELKDKMLQDNVYNQHVSWSVSVFLFGMIRNKAAAPD